MTTEKLGNKKNPKRDIHGFPWEGQIDKTPEKIESIGERKEEREEGVKNKGKGKDNMQKQGGTDGKRTEQESREIYILIKGNVGLARNLAAGKNSQNYTRITLAKNPNSYWRG